MAGQSKIEWTDVSWNPVFGCSKVSEGCRNCYAESMANRLAGMGQPKYMLVTTNGRWNGTMSASDEVIYAPMNWKKPRRVFVNSMSDLFHENLSLASGYHQKIFEVMLACPQHTFQILTKRPRRMRIFLNNHEPWRKALAEGRAGHIWVGVSVENQKAADERIPQLQKTHAAVRFLSCEPLLGPLNIYGCDAQYHPQGVAAGPMVSLEQFWTADGKGPFPGIDWVIAGGESGPNARPMHPNWARQLRDQCQTAGVPFFFKQWGGFKPILPFYGDKMDADTWMEAAAAFSEDPGKMRMVLSSGHCHNWPYQENFQPDPADDPWFMERVGKGKAGRMLDGRTWEEMPDALY